MTTPPQYTCRQKYYTAGPVEVFEVPHSGKPTREAAIADFILWKRKCIAGYKTAIVRDEAAIKEAERLR